MSNLDKLVDQKTEQRRAAEQRRQEAEEQEANWRQYENAWERVKEYATLRPTRDQSPEAFFHEAEAAFRSLGKELTARKRHKHLDAVVEAIERGSSNIDPRYQLGELFIAGCIRRALDETTAPGTIARELQRWAKEEDRSTGLSAEADNVKFRFLECAQNQLLNGKQRHTPTTPTAQPDGTTANGAAPGQDEPKPAAPEVSGDKKPMTDSFDSKLSWYSADVKAKQALKDEAKRAQADRDDQKGRLQEAFLAFTRFCRYGTPAQQFPDAARACRGIAEVIASDGWKLSDGVATDPAEDLVLELIRYASDASNGEDRIAERFGRLYAEFGNPLPNVKLPPGFPSRLSEAAYRPYLRMTTEPASAAADMVQSAANGIAAAQNGEPAAPEMTDLVDAISVIEKAYEATAPLRELETLLGAINAGEQQDAVGTLVTSLKTLLDVCKARPDHFIPAGMRDKFMAEASNWLAMAQGAWQLAYHDISELRPVLRWVVLSVEAAREKLGRELREQMLVSPIPRDLNNPPSVSDVWLPVESRVQDLPFDQITWENFEKLCLRLARVQGDVDGCRPYGVQGDTQEGIDFYARRIGSDRYTVYQCKNEKNFTPQKIRDAVSRFLVGEWAGKTERFVLCTRESLKNRQRSDALEEQRSVLKQRGIDLDAWDSHELSIQLKTRPELVAEFFRPEWVLAFCDPEAARAYKNVIMGDSLR